MALSPATGLANYSAGISSSVLHVDSNSDRVGIGTTNPQDTLQVGTAITMGSGTVTATQGNFQNVSIAGTLTYEDVSSIDAVGIITAQSGITITGGGLSVVGDTDLVGNLTGVNATGISSIANVSGTTLNITGVTTISNTVVGGATTELVVNGDARITGILTMGTSSITLDGTQNKIISGKYDFLGISTSHNDTAVDVFVYDTSKDSDGGDWRKKTSYTSWYNETLNTATRGSRKEFPAVAVIVAEAAKVTIYDGDDPDLPMWMVFETNSSDMLVGNGINAVTVLNGILSVVRNTPIVMIDFIKDNQTSISPTAETHYIGNIEQRNDGLGYTASIGTRRAVANGGNDVAMTVLPNAPIDDTTGLPIPTIVVATNGGASLIKDDGNVYDDTDTSSLGSIDFNDEYRLISTRTSTGSGQTRFFVSEPVNTVSSDSSWLYDYYTGNFAAGYPRLRLDDTGAGVVSALKGDTCARGSNIGFALWNVNNEDELSTGGNYTNSLLCGIATSYNTGWMHGDIKLATLSSNVGAAITFTNLSTNGDLADSSDLSSWTAYNATLSHQTDAMRVADNGNNSKAYQSFTTVDGRKYIASVNCKTLSGSDAVFSIGNASPAQTSWNNNGTVQESTIGVKSLVFTASGTTNYVELGSTGSGYAEYQDVRIDEVKVEDRSVNNNPLELYGTVTKSAVATGADLVAYSGFSASSALVQPYNSDMNPGTGDYSLMFWVKTSATSGEEAYFRRISTSGGCMMRMTSSTSLIQWYTSDASDAFTANSNFALDDGNWHCVVGTREGSRMKLYVDGVLHSSSATSAISHDSTTNDQVIIGAEFTATPGTFQNPADASTIALLRYSLSAPSIEQVKKIYEDEKCLFHENAQATLYGSSDAVTALAYDEVTDQLHVGTSSGRSDFQGLRRINNTTTAVTTAISAHDSFIIEQ